MFVCVHAHVYLCASISSEVCMCVCSMCVTCADCRVCVCAGFHLYIYVCV